ncbi:hypothetical protein MMC14_010057 [Varicellaria rhodocarpa]|nr:hypothetical protein [Varicellaria rhodocarpa]
MTDQTSVARVLGLPELLSTVLSFYGYKRSTLASCMRVNNLWANEAAPYLWERCGAGFWDGFKPPLIRDLATLASNPDRLQWYARFVRKLQFADGNRLFCCAPPGASVEFDGSGDPTEYVHVFQKTKEDAWFHSSFQNIEFPRLEYLFIHASDHGVDLNSCSSLLVYFQPNLKELRVESATLSEDFFNSVKVLCPGLRTLDLTTKAGHNIEFSARTFSDCIAAMRSLSVLRMRYGWMNLWSAEILGGLALHQSLSNLEMPNIPDDWLRSLTATAEDLLFLKVHTLVIGVSDTGLEILMPRIKNVSKLELFLQGPSTNALATIASLPNLTSLQLHFSPGSVIRGTDLISLAENCKCLEYIRVAHLDFPQLMVLPTSERISDTTIDHLAWLLPDLREFHLAMSDTILTDAALISLGSHCKHLWRVSLAADIFIEDVVRKTHPNFFPTLAELNVILPESASHHYETPEETAEAFLKTVPEFCSLELYHPEGLDNEVERFADVVSDMARPEIRLLRTGTKSIDEEERTTSWL